MSEKERNGENEVGKKDRDAKGRCPSRVRSACMIEKEEKLRVGGRGLYRTSSVQVSANRTNWPRGGSSTYVD